MKTDFYRTRFLMNPDFTPDTAYNGAQPAKQALILARALGGQSAFVKRCFQAGEDAPARFFAETKSGGFTYGFFFGVADGKLTAFIQYTLEALSTSASLRFFGLPSDCEEIALEWQGLPLGLQDSRNRPILNHACYTGHAAQDRAFIEFAKRCGVQDMRKYRDSGLDGFCTRISSGGAGYPRTQILP